MNAGDRTADTTNTAANPNFRPIPTVMPPHRRQDGGL